MSIILFLMKNSRLDKYTNDEYRGVIKESLFLGFFYKGEATKENPFGTICGVNQCDKVDILSELKNIVCVGRFFYEEAPSTSPFFP